MRHIIVGGLCLSHLYRIRGERRGGKRGMEEGCLPDPDVYSMEYKCCIVVIIIFSS